MEINSKKIQLEMDRMGWSVEEVADRMDRKVQWVYFVMSNKGSHTFRTVERFALALGVDPKDLVI
tara:strand:+ start:364 stop:558 length:195 start_codon:yes stop_codon:yes gene_type:complete